MSHIPKRPIRIATAAFPPYVNECGIYTLQPTKECPHPGVDHEILYFLLEYAKVPYRLFPLTGKVDWGELQPDGTMSGLAGDVIDGIYDTVSTTYLMSIKHNGQIQFSYNVYYETEYYIVSNALDPYREWIYSATLIYRVLDIYLTLGMLGVLLILVIMLLIFNRLLDISSSSQRFDRALLMDSINSFHDAMTLIFKGRQKRPYLSTRLLFLILAFTVLLMFNLYHGGLFRIMIAPLNFNKKETENSIIDKLESKEFRLIETRDNYDNTELYQSIRFKDDPFYVRFRKILQQNPVIIENDMIQLREKLLSNYGYVKFSGNQLRAYNSGIARCDIPWIPASYHKIAWEAFIFRNGSEWRPYFFSNMIMIEKVIDSLYSKYLNKSDSCVIGNNHEHQPVKSLHIVTLFSAFLLPILGGLAGIGLVGVEIAKNGTKMQHSEHENSHNVKDTDC